MSADSDNPTPAPGTVTLAEVKYSLPDMLEELKAERAAATFAMERLEQSEIGKLFKTKPRAKSKK